MTSYSKVFDADYYYQTYPDLQTAIGGNSLDLFTHFTLPECPKAGKDAQILMSTCTKKTIPISRQRLEAI